jgi:hypothetical protein
MDHLHERLEALEHRTHTVERQLRWWRGLACGLIVLALLTWALPSVTAQDSNKGLAQRMAAQRASRQDPPQIRGDDRGHDVSLLGKLALHATPKADLTQASDERHLPQPGAQLSDRIVLGPAATPGDHLRPRGRGSPFRVRHFWDLPTVSDTSQDERLSRGAAVSRGLHGW